MNKVKHKTLTRDIITQTITAGTLTGIWLGDKKNPYLYIFDDVEFAFPAYRREGDWVVWVDLAMFDGMSEIDRMEQLENLSPYVTLADYKKYQADRTKCQYIELPLERSVCLRTHTLKRNQRLGVSWATQGLYDILHKKKLKDMETTVANKIINAVAIVTVGNEANPNLGLKTDLKRKVFGGVKSALEKSNTQGVTCIAVPEWADIKFPDLKSDALNPEKFETLNTDIDADFGMSQMMKNGTGGNYASGNINFEIFYKRIAVLLEDIESEVFGKLINLILPTSARDSYRAVYDKQPPLSLKDKLDILYKLHQEGWAIKPILDLLDGVDFVDYVTQSLYEQETMKLREKILPYQTSSTMTNNGEKSGSDSNNENTIKSDSNDSNNVPTK